MGAIENVTAHGVTLTLENGVLYASPVECLTDELRAFIRDNKPQLIAEIAQMPPQSCSTCGYLNVKFTTHYCMSPQAKRFTPAALQDGESCPQWVSSWAIGWRDWNN